MRGEGKRRRAAQENGFVMVQPDPSEPRDAARLKLRDSRAELEVTPAGGCITAFRWQEGGRTIDWLRPAAGQGPVAAGDSACYPLVPFSNRIRDGRFSFEGRDFQLARNFAPAPHAIHGHGWEGLWQVAGRGDDHLTLSFAHVAEDWPSAYRAEQRFELQDGSLAVTLTLTNSGRQAMPAGLGLHPYFPRRPGCRLTAPVGQMWATDAEVMPTELVSPTAGADPAAGLLPDEAALDNCFTGFAGRAVIDWPEQRRRLTLEADAALRFLVVFTPPGRDFFCVEPVSHCTDAVNLAAAGRDDTGLKVLRPGESFTARLCFRPQLDVAA